MITSSAVLCERNELGSKRGGGGGGAVGRTDLLFNDAAADVSGLGTFHFWNGWQFNQILQANKVTVEPTSRPGKRDFTSPPISPRPRGVTPIG